MLFKILDVYCIPTFAPNHPQLTYLLFCSTLMEEKHLALHTVVNLLFSNYSSKEHIFSFIRDGPGVFDIHLMIPWSLTTPLDSLGLTWRLPLLSGAPLTPSDPNTPLFLKSSIISRTYRSCFYKNDKPNESNISETPAFWVMDISFISDICYLLHFTHCKH